MKVILTADVKGSGKKGDLVNVSDGYAKNFLLPKNLAVEATASALNELKQKQSSEQHKLDVAKEEAENNKAAVDKKKVVIRAKAGADSGRLFGAITNKDVAEAIEKQFGVKVDKKKVSLKNDIKNFGTYTADVKFMTGISAEITVEVTEA